MTREFLSSESNVVRRAPPEVEQDTGRFFSADPRQWGLLIARATKLGLVQFGRKVKAVAGFFTVWKKGKQRLRWLFDGRKVTPLANRLDIVFRIIYQAKDYVPTFVGMHGRVPMKMVQVVTSKEWRVMDIISEVTAKREDADTAK